MLTDVVALETVVSLVLVDARQVAQVAVEEVVADPEAESVLIV